MRGAMKHPFFRAGLIVVAAALTAQSASLPDDVISFNRKVELTIACHPKGETIEQVTESLAALQSRKECVDLEHERAALMERHKDNKDALNALRPKFGFVSVYRPQN